ncbi:MAG: ABC transporter permease [Cyclobacteriaceae bacterium]
MKRPPHWADRLLEALCRADRLEDVQGDLHEFFYRRVDEGSKYAHLIYWIDVLNFSAKYAKVKLKIHMNFFLLLSSYWKTTIRNMGRNKLFSTINVFGLAVSMAVALLMTVFVVELLSFDRFHSKYDQIYRVYTTYENASGEEMDLASTSAVIGDKLRDKHSSLDKVVTIRRNFDGDFEVGEKVINVSGLWASNEFLDVFDFKVIEGDPKSALINPNSLVLTKQTADKFFGEGESVVGNVLTMVSGGGGMSLNDSRSFTITAVVEDPPKNSHIKFDGLGSFVTFQEQVRQEEEGLSTVDDWSSIWMFHTYLVMKEDADMKAFSEFLDDINQTENAEFEYRNYIHKLEPLSQVVPGKDYSNNIGPTVDRKVIYILLALTAVILLSACFNYTNLSIARSIRRTKEVGVRKVAGASTSQVAMQFLFEAIVLSALAFVVAFGVFYLLRAIALDVLNISLVNLAVKPIYFIYFLFLILLIGTIAGLIPSMVLSRIKAIGALKSSNLQLWSGMGLRKGLTVFQFTLSIGFIIVAFVAHKQYKYSLNYDLGFETENVLNVRTSATDNSQLLLNAFEQVAGVKGAAESAMIISSGSVYTESMKYEDPMDSIEVHLNYVDHNYIPLHEFELIAGRNFVSRPDSVESHEVIANEKVLSRFGIGEPSEAIGKRIKLDRQNYTIVGVVKDFQHVKISDPIHEFVFIHNTQENYWVHLKVQTSDIVSLMDRLEAVYREIDPIHPFQAEFFDERIERAYGEYSVMYKVIGFVAFLTISIAALGLLGMAVYTAENKIKEISIRKVLGASQQEIMISLSRGFFSLILIAGFVAIPLTYLLFEKVILVDYVNRIQLGVFELSSGLLITLSIAAFMIVWQTRRAANANPADTLRNE